MGDTKEHGTVKEPGEDRGFDGLLGKDFSESIINTLPGIFFVLGQDGRFVRWNSRLEHLSEYAARELAAMHGLDLVVDEHRERARQALRQAFESGSTEIEVDCKARSGRIVPVCLTGCRATIGGGTYLIGIGLDITERSQTQQRLADERNLLRTVIDNIPDSIYVKDRESRFVLCNREVLRRKGVTSLDEITGRTDFDFYPPALAEAVYADEQELMATGQPLLNQERRVEDRQTDAATWNLTSKVPLYNSRGETTGLVGIGRDITERKRAQEAYHALVDHSLQGLVVIQDMKLVFANQAMADISGYTVAEMLAMPPETLRDFIHPEDREMVWQYHQARLHGGSLPERHEFRAVRKDGSVRWLEIHTSRIEYQGRSAVQAACVDATERHQAEYLKQVQQDVAVKLSSLSNLQEGLRYCLEIALQAAGMDCGGIYIVDDTSGDVELVVHAGLSDAFTAGEAHYPASSQNAQIVMRGEPVYGSFRTLRLRQGPAQRREELRGIGVIPIRHDDCVIACLNVGSHANDDVSPSSRVVLETIATQIGSAISRLRMQEALERTEREKAVILNTMSEIVTYHDPSHRILWANRAAMTALGMTADQIVGRRCHELWDGRTEPCENCPVDRALQTGCSHEIETTGYNQGIWLVRGEPVKNENGRIIGVVELALDITERKRAEEQLRRRLEIEELVTSVSTDFVNARAEEIETATDRALERIGRCAGVDRSYLYMLHDNGARMSKMHGWCANGIDPRQGWGRDLRIDRLPWGIDHLANSGLLNIPSVRDLQGEAAEAKDLLTSMGVKSLLSVPVTIGGRLFGFLGLSTTREERSWPEETISLLRTIADILANALERKRSADALKERLAFETLLSDLSATFVNLPDAEIDSQIEHWLGRIGELLGIDRSSILRFSDSGPDVAITHTWAAPGLPRGSTARMTQSFRWFLEKLRNGELVVYARIEDAPQEAESEKQYCRQEGIQSALAFPLVVGGARIGGMAFSTVRKQRDWPDDLVQRLRLVGEIFANALLRKQAQEALRRSEEQFRSIFENAVLGLYRTAPDGRILLANPALVRMLGYSCFEELAECNVEKNGYQPSYSRAAFKRLIELQGQVVGLESAWTKRDGTALFIRENARAVRDLEGNILYYEGTVEDVTERKRAEQALAESEARFRELVELLPQTVFEMDADGNFTFANRAGLEMFGCTEQEVPGLNVLQLFAPADHERIGRNVRKKLAGEPFQDHDYMALRKDGSTFPVLLYSSPIVRDGKPVGLRGIVLDISDRKKAETALRESEEKFRNLAEQSPNMIFINKAGRVVYANARCEQLMGYTREEFCSTDFNFLTMVSPECRERMRENFSAHMRGQEAPSVEYALITKAGRRIDAILTTRLIQYEGEKAILGTVTDITDRKRAEKSLQELQDIVSRSPVLVFLWRVAPGVWPVEFVSDNVERSLGYTADDFTSGRVSWPGITHPDDVPRLEAEVARYLEAGIREWSQEYRLITRSGQVRWFTDQNLALADADGKITRIQSILLDITERRRMEDALCESERKYRALYEGSRDGTVAMDLAGRILHCNSLFLDMLGYRGEEIAQRTHQEITPPRWLAEEERIAREQVCERGYSDVYEKEYIREDGSVFPAEIRVYLNTDNEGHPVGTWALVRDITERKRAELALRASERNYREIFNAANEAIFVHHPVTGQILDVNQMMLQLYGYSYEEALQLNVADLSFGESPYSEQDALTWIRKADEEGSQLFERLSRNRKGEIFWEEVNLKSAVIGGERRILAVVRDVTERKKAETQAQQHLAELTRAWHARTLGEMASGLAHELNQPLCAILNYSNGCLRLSRKEQFSIEILRNSIDQIAAQAERAAGIIKRICGLIAKREPERAALDLQSILREAVHMLHSEAARHDVAMIARLGPDLPMVKGDSVEIEQVALNLMRNAIEAMSDVDIRSRTLTISSSRLNDREVEVAVTDTGRGVSADLSEKIFESFFTTKDQGLGIGLSLSRRIVEAHGGRLWVESGDGPGATFRFTLPVEGAAHGDGKSHSLHRG